MRYSPNHHGRSVAAHTVTRRCRRCRRCYRTAVADPDDLCAHCCHNKDFDQRVANWFLKNPFLANCSEQKANTLGSIIYEPGC